MISLAPSPRLSPWRVALTLILLTATVLVMGLPPRPTLPVGAVDAPAITAFVANGLRLLLTVGLWYLLATTALTAVAGLPRVGGAIRPLARRLAGVGLSAVLRRVLATSAVVGVSLPSAAGAGSSTAEDPPVMVPIDPTTIGETDEGSTESVTIRQAETPAADGTAADRPTPTSTGSEPPMSTTADAQDFEGRPRGASTPRPNSAPGAAPSMRRDEPLGTDLSPRSSPTVGPEAPTMNRATGNPPTEAGARQTTATEPAVTGTARSARHVVEAGESFWTIAEDIARSEVGGQEADLATIAATWQQLVDHNANILVDPGNPDLLHRGQVVDLTGDAATPRR